MSSLLDRRRSHSDRRRSLIHPIRPHHNHTSHAICLEKFIQVLLHNETSAARSVTHEKPFAISYDDPGMKNIEVLACGHKENQITGLQMPLQPWYSRLWQAFDARPPCCESRHNLQDAFPAER